MDHHKIKLLNWNANGLFRQINEFKHFLNDQKIDIACATETHLNNAKRINIPNYITYREDRASLHGGGGVAILIKRKIKHTQIFVPTSKELEITAITIDLSVGKLTIIVAYKPPNKKIPKISLELLINNNDKVLLIGDLNEEI